MIVSVDTGLARLLLAGGIGVTIGAVALFIAGSSSLAWVVAYCGIAMVIGGIVQSVDVHPEGAWDRKNRVTAVILAVCSLAAAAFGVLWLIAGSGERVVGTSVVAFIFAAFGVWVADAMYRDSRGLPQRHLPAWLTGRGPPPRPNETGDEPPTRGFRT